MQAKTDHTKPEPRSLYGQFGETVATGTYKTPHATQRVAVKPVVPRRPSGRANQPKPTVD